MDNYTKMCGKLTELQEMSWEVATSFDENAIFKPSLEQLIGMLEGRDWKLQRLGGEYSVNETESNSGIFGNTPQEALLKLVAYELYGKVWNADKEAWEEG